MAQSDIDHPSHYAHPTGVECLEIAGVLPFVLGNAVKYLWRAGRKGSPASDLRKAAWYLRQGPQHLRVSALPVAKMQLVASHPSTHTVLRILLLAFVALAERNEPGAIDAGACCEMLEKEASDLERVS